MGYLVVENFGEGLDSRRSFVTTKAGALLECKNAHITRGKEIEKRKKFATFASLPSNTFGLQTAGNSLYVFGSVATPSGLPATINYQRLQSLSGSAMTELVFSETFNGKIYAIAKFADGSINHFFDGARISTWDTIAGSVASNIAVAASLATQIGSETYFDAVATGSNITITGQEGIPFSLSLSAINGGANNNQALTQSTSQTPIVGIPATGTILSLNAAAVELSSQIDATANFLTSVSGSLIVITGPAGVAFTLTGSTVNGGSNSNQTISTLTIQNAIVGDSSATPPVTAVSQISRATLGGTFEPNDQFRITLAIPSTGYSQTFSVTTSTPAVIGQPQITTVSVGGTFEANDVFSITASIPSIAYSKQFSISASSSGVGTTVKTFGSKVYSTTNSLLYYSKISDPTQWGGTTEGAGFINLTTQDGGAENLTAIGVYQGKLAIFSKRNIQIWSMDADPFNNINTQTLSNIGTFAPRSVVAFGDIDVFFLSESGVRSIRARDASNAATVSDIGTAIDTLLQSEMAALPETTRNAAVGIIEPTDGRYWISIGPKIYVFSYFPGSGVSAWSTYEPGFTVSHISYANGRVYLRSGNTIYLYGGLTGNEYDDCEVSITLPFLDGGKPAHTKTIQAIDIACENTWSISIGMDVSAPNERDVVGSVTNSTFAIGRILHFGVGTHVGAKLRCASNGYARLANMALHYTIAGAE